jgi:hypothetical protein
MDAGEQWTTDLWRISFAKDGAIFPDAANLGCFLAVPSAVPSTGRGLTADISGCAAEPRPELWAAR